MCLICRTFNDQLYCCKTVRTKLLSKHHNFQHYKNQIWLRIPRLICLIRQRLPEVSQLLTVTWILTIFSHERQLLIMTYKFLDQVKTNHQAEYLGQTSFGSKVIVRTHTDTHTGTIALPGPLKWSVTTWTIAVRRVLSLSVAAKDGTFSTLISCCCWPL